jgi:UDP-N-acetyl-D-mannosaminuronic acid dehydrogenase
MALQSEKKSKIDQNFNVCILGIGFVGLTLAIALAKRDIPVIGLDVNADLIKSLNKGETDVIEPDIKEFLQESLQSGKLSFIHSSENLSILKSCNTFILTVGTPLSGSEINLGSITNAINQIIEYISEEDLVILRSTTSVGTANEVVRPILDKKSKSISLAMCPERTIEGNAMQEIFHLPQLVGADDEVSFAKAKSLFESLGTEVVKLSSLKSAELAKLINNTYRDLMFGFANEIATFCQKINVSASEIINAANYKYPRSNISLPGPSGGPCLEKDPWILVQSGRQHGVELAIARSAREVNENSVLHLLDSHFVSEVSEKVVLLGLSFKGTPEILDARGSFAKNVIHFIKQRNPLAEIMGYDPAGIFRSDFIDIAQSQSIQEAVSDANKILILTNSIKFFDLERLITNLADPHCLVIDYWQVAKRAFLSKEMRYVSWS